MVISDILIGPMAEQSYSADPDIEQILRAAFGEWPDVLGEDTDLPALAKEAGLSCAASLDATANILPSLHFAATTQAGSKTETKDVLADAADLLSRLYEQGLCRYVYMRFDKTDDVF